MASKKLIALTDTDDQIRYFTEDDLIEQLAGADFPGTAPIKAAYKHFANLVAEMRKAQTQYFAASHGTPEKAATLKRSKNLEAQVDTITKTFTQTLSRL